MKDKPSASFSFGAFETAIITLVLIGLKLTVSPDLPWPVVLAPLWIPAALLALILGVPAIIMVLGLLACTIFGGACLIWEFVSEIWKGGRKP
jgi:hypothetical protein